MYRLGEAVGNVPDMQAAAQYEYGPFGELTGVTGVQGQRQPFRFSTKYTDAETGLLYYGYRYYSPSMGRWCSRDPIGEQASFNIYEFVFNNPECDIDPVGLDDYKKGKDDPAVSKDAGAGKFGVEDPTTIDQNKHNTWSRIVIPMARDDFGWTDAAAHMQHYLDASGDDYTIRFQAMLDDVPSAKKWYDYEKQQAMDFSETLTVGTHDITSSSIPPGLYNTQDESPNWYYAVGGYSAWGKGKVTVTACGDGGADTKFVLEFHYKFQDRYNWDKGKSVKIGGQTVNDSSMGRLHTVGLAKEFDMFGEVTETVTWTKTTRTPGRIAKPGPKKR
jgi:RHS repeat-associated protein